MNNKKDINITVPPYVANTAIEAPLVKKIKLSLEDPDMIFLSSNGKEIPAVLKPLNENQAMLICIPPENYGEKKHVKLTGKYRKKAKKSNSFQKNLDSPLKIEKKDFKNGNSISIIQEGKIWTEFRYGDFKTANRPFLYPLIVPSGVGVTRNYPMKEVKGESQDHIHHTGVWTAWGKVNRTDNWAYGKKKGRQKVKSIQIKSYGVFGEIKAVIEWVKADGSPQLQEKRKITIFNTKNARLIDFDIHLTAAYGKIKLKDTKEGGFLSVRVATPMDVRNGGKIQQSTGAISEHKGKDSEKKVWGKRAEWCDYSGIIDGKEVGVAILDHPDNPIHPTYWHVRNYGLMTANPFGISYFKGGFFKRGTLKLKKNESIQFKYRLIAHDGDAEEAKIAQHYEAYKKQQLI